MGRPGMKQSREDLKKILYWMILGRRIEEKVTVLIKEGRLRGHHHPGTGQEAANVGVSYGLKDDDYLSLMHRGKNPELIKGMSLKSLMAGYFGKKEGVAGGRAPTGSHMYGDLSKGIVPYSGIIGAVIPVAVGVGLGLKLNGRKQVIVCLFGDGAANRGDFHEGMNMAAALKLPVVFALINNGYAMSVSVERATGMKSLVTRATGYGIPGVSIDGNDVRKVIETIEKAVARARKGEGPSLVECMVNRWTGHSISDSDVYRTDEEKSEAKKNDPIARFKRELIAESVINEEEYGRIEMRVKEEIEEAVRYCEKECTDPDPAVIMKGVYAAT
jgi:TPP-dependent pyruvate/acetoin dehydrogenase alpha subunit